MAEPSQEQVNSGTPSFTKEQLEQLVKILQPSKISVYETPSCSFTQIGNSPITFFTCSKIKCTWIIDSSATDHMTENSNLFSSYKPCAGNKEVKIVDASFFNCRSGGHQNLTFCFPCQMSFMLQISLAILYQSVNSLKIKKVVLNSFLLIVNFRTWPRGEQLAMLESVTDSTYCQR